MARRVSRLLVPDGERRIADRAPVAIEADLRRAGRTPFKVLLRDLSPTGSRAETLSRVILHDRIWVTIPGFSAIEGVVRWVRGQHFGIEWEGRIHPAVFEHIRVHFPEAF
jgi:PilZ domain